MYFDEMGNVVVCIQLMELYVDVDVINCKLCGNDMCSTQGRCQV
jgi:hypothetical protein